MTGSVHTWIADYTEHLEQGVAVLRGGGTPDAAWRAGCQEFDDQVRAFDARALQAGFEGGRGPALAAGLRAAQAAFEEAHAARHEGLDESLQSVRSGRKGLRGYGEASRRMTTGSPIYIERRY